jgi:hypothetical protein
MIKQSRLAVKNIQSGFQMHLKTEQKPSGLSPFENWIVRISDVGCKPSIFSYGSFEGQE